MDAAVTQATSALPGIPRDDDGPVFTNCNVCGIRLRTRDEDEMGMCEACADD